MTPDERIKARLELEGNPVFTALRLQSDILLELLREAPGVIEGDWSAAHPDDFLARVREALRKMGGTVGGESRC